MMSNLRLDRPSNSNSITRRRGVALMAVVVVLVILSLMMSAIAWQIVISGRQLQHREYELQAESLARAGIEIAAARLLETPEGNYRNALELIERSSLAIEIESVPNSPNAYQITSLARYPTDLIGVVLRKQTRTFKRVVDEETVRLEWIAGNDDAQ